jgi:hypothetical protein
VVLGNGDTFAAHMVYDGTTLTLTITDGVTNTSFTTSWTINIPQIVGGNTAYVGFTAGSGGHIGTPYALVMAYQRAVSGCQPDVRGMPAVSSNVGLDTARHSRGETPMTYAIQAEGCAPIVRAFAAGDRPPLPHQQRRVHPARNYWDWPGAAVADRAFVADIKARMACRPVAPDRHKAPAALELLDETERLLQ